MTSRSESGLFLRDYGMVDTISGIYKKHRLSVILALLSLVLAIIIIVLLALPTKTYCPPPTAIATTATTAAAATAATTAATTTTTYASVTCPTYTPPCKYNWVNHMGYCVRSPGNDMKYTLDIAKKYCTSKGASVISNSTAHVKFLEYVWTGVNMYWLDSNSTDCYIGSQSHIPMVPKITKVSCNQRHPFICIKYGTAAEA